MRFARDFFRRYVGLGIALLGGTRARDRMVARHEADREIPASAQTAATSREPGEERASRACGCAIETARHEEALRLSQQQLELVIENAKDTALFTLDTAGGIASWNAAATRIFGYDAKEIIAQNISRFYLDEDVASGRPRHDLEAAVSGGRHAHECRVATGGWANAHRRQY